MSDTTNKAVLAARTVDAKDAIEARRLRAAVLNTVALRKRQVGDGPWTARDIQVVDTIDAALTHVMALPRYEPEESTNEHPPQEPIDQSAVLAGIVGKKSAA